MVLFGSQFKMPLSCGVLGMGYGGERSPITPIKDGTLESKLEPSPPALPECSPEV
jgi:hypothetical protein